MSGQQQVVTSDQAQRALSPAEALAQWLTMYAAASEPGLAGRVAVTHKRRSRFLYRAYRSGGKTRLEVGLLPVDERFDAVWSRALRSATEVARGTTSAVEVRH